MMKAEEGKFYIPFACIPFWINTLLAPQQDPVKKNSNILSSADQDSHETRVPKTNSAICVKDFRTKRFYKDERTYLGSSL